MLSLQKRLHISFAIALALVLVTGLTSLYYIREFDQQVRQTLVVDIDLAESSEQLRNALREESGAFAAYVNAPGDAAAYETMLQRLDAFLADVDKSRSISLVEDNITIHEDILKDGRELRVLMEGVKSEGADRSLFIKSARSFLNGTRARVETIQKHRRQEMASHRTAIQRLFNRAQQNQILIIIVMFIGGAFLAFFMPRRTVWPFRRLLQAFHEAWECNLSVRLPVQGADELAELSGSFNRMMAQLEELDEMKVKRIAFERRRFEVLSNSLDMGVVLVTIEGKILFINAPAFRVFNVTSTQVINRDVETAPLPKEVIELLQEGLTTKQRMENREWQGVFTTPAGREIKRRVNVDIMPVRTHAGDLVNLIMFLEELDTSHEKRLFQKEAHIATETDDD